MRKFIFITSEGFTFQPDSEDYEPDIENLQVVGFGEGDTIDSALKSMFKENSYLSKSNFNKVIGIEIKDYKQTILYLKEFAS